MNRKKTTAILTILLMAALVTPIAFAAKPEKAGPAEKATGEFWFDHPQTECGLAYVRFDAHEAQDDRPVKGEFYYSDDIGYYLFEVGTFSIEAENTAYFSGPVVDSNYPGIPVGAIVYISVFDGGTPGTEGDMLNGNVNAAVEPPKIPVIAGNLVVHTYD